LIFRQIPRKWQPKYAEIRKFSGHVCSRIRSLAQDISQLRVEVVSLSLLLLLLA